MEKWQEQVEEILRKQYPGDEERLKKANELVGLAREVKPPHGDVGQFVIDVLNLAGKELSPLAAAYTGFRLGVAYERYQNENRA
ncbi:hypothetical protein ES703_98432 [subsurface metagenome]